MTDLGYLDSLNAAQYKAVTTIDGPLLVLAGAGTGKTRVLTTRLCHILQGGRAYPSQILAVTFTNKAAMEMKERAAHMLGHPVEGMWIGTFHSLCLRILRQHAEAIKLNPQFTILDTDDQLRLLKQIIRADNIDEKRYPPRSIMSVIQRWKDKGYTPAKVPKGDHSKPAYQVYKKYQDRLQILNAVDFGDLLLHCLEIFLQQPDILKSFQNKFRYLLVDEYQDTNVTQYLWLRLLSQEHKNICCVGDDDQSIYSWRGAEITNILRFEQDFPGAEVICLEENYRSTEHILAAASHLIAQNHDRYGKTLQSGLGQGSKVKVKGIWDSLEEARITGEEIEDFHRHGIMLNNMAILVRASFQTREFEDRLMTIGIPYRVIGGARFYERMEIRDAIAYMRIIASSQDGLAFERIVNTPRRGIGATSVQTLHEYARHKRISLYEAAQTLLQTDEIRGKARGNLLSLIMDIQRWQNMQQTLSPSDLAKLVLDESGYMAMWKTTKTADAPGRIENLKEFVRALEDFSTLTEFLEHVSLVMENTAQSNGDCVNIMTMHGAKGLEFEVVFLPGWEEGLFPHQMSLAENGPQGLEEERRLAYVGLTRAKRHAIISFANNRRVHGVWQSNTPSRFIEELPKDSIEIITQPGLRPLERQRQTPHISEVPSSSIGQSSAEFKVGVRVFHQKFGYGYVRFVEGDRLTIHFDHAGEKKVMASFVQDSARM